MLEADSSIASNLLLSASKCRGSVRWYSSRDHRYSLRTVRSLMGSLTMSLAPLGSWPCP